ncbi:MAG TPA: maleylacetoacetate isomerase [Steroidobacteraceae bacterium]|nr:maleylacetoacetate isomerase [Steroidobacteraceae bacterium]
MLRLYTYFRSSAAYRVRIALHLKGLPFEALPVHLLRGGGEQHAPAFAALNPAELVPVLEDSGLVLTQSLAIIEYLEERHPVPALLPAEPAARARVRALALAIAADIHPLANLRVMRHLQALDVDAARRREWSRHWVTLGLTAVERMLQADAPSGACCHGDAPTLADCCLVPQIFNALRLDCPLERWPTLRRIYAHCMTLDAFQRAAPAGQSDAE